MIPLADSCARSSNAEVRAGAAPQWVSRDVIRIQRDFNGIPWGNYQELYLVGGFKPWNFMFHNIWDVILPIELFYIFQRGWNSSTNQLKNGWFLPQFMVIFSEGKGWSTIQQKWNFPWGFHPGKKIRRKPWGSSAIFLGGWWWDVSPVFGLRVRYFFLGYFRRGYSVSKGWCQYCGMVMFIILNIFLKVIWHILHASHVLIMAQTTRVAK